MALTNNERVGKALENLRAGLAPFVQRELQEAYGDTWHEKTNQTLADTKLAVGGSAKEPLWDVLALLVLIDREWRDIFKSVLSRSDRSIAIELMDVRNSWAHQETFSNDDTDRALDSVQRLLTGVTATAEADAVGKLKYELRRATFDRQVHNERRKEAYLPVEGQPSAGLKPWREVVMPHPDVASGRFKQAEFAADLWQVYIGEGEDEYRDPVQFFRRTFLTNGLELLLTNALRRLGGEGGDPVIKLQTNFGGGKTHSMLALFHLFSGRRAAELAGLEDVFAKAGVKEPPKIRRAVLVGNKISPGAPEKKPDGCVVRTLWGELAWQLGGKEGYALVKADDEHATNPGDTLRKLFNKFGPCLILIDEWVAYARQLHDNSALPGGDFDTHFTFAQALTEAVRATKNSLVVVSIPASDDPTAINEDGVSDLEVGGVRGREALKKLENIIGRNETPWRSATGKESFEIVRRRLFQPITDPRSFVARDTVARAFAEMYRANKAEFPPDATEGAYEQSIKDAYPIHPEIFKRLNDDWSTLVTFQRTRGVLRLMAAVIHSLWEREDKSLIIMPGSLPIDDPVVQPEFTRYLPPTWAPVIEHDVDGPDALPLQIDRSKPNLGRYSAARRVARTVYLGSAPTLDAANKGIEDLRIKLGCTQPGEAVAVFGDALRYLSESATYLYVNGRRYWFSTQPTVNRLADERAGQRTTDDVFEEIRRRMREDAVHRGDFTKVHAVPASTGDVADEPGARLVVLGPETVHAAKEAESPARRLCVQLLDWRGNSPRNYANALAFLAPDRTRFSELEKAARMFLAWKSIDDQHKELNLDTFQQNQAKTKHEQWNDTVRRLVAETYIWLIVPEQSDPKDKKTLELRELKLTGTDSVGIRASKRMKNEGLLLASWAGSALRLELDRVPLWRGNHVSVKTLAEDFAKYPYLQRLRSSDVLAEAIADGVSSMTWSTDSFAYADSWDEAAKRYRNLRAGRQILVDPDSDCLVVKPDIAAEQATREAANTSTTPGAQVSGPGTSGGTTGIKGSQPPLPPQPAKLTRFYGTVEVDPVRVNKDVQQISQEVVQHFAGMLGAKVKLTLEIQATAEQGFPEDLIRTVRENSTTLKFSQRDFSES